MAHSAPDLVSVPTRLPPLTRELWLLFHRDIGRSPTVRAVIDRITAITAAARCAFLGQQAAGRVVDPVIPWKRGLPYGQPRRGLIPVKTISAPTDNMELVLVLPPQQEGLMSRFVVRFLKDVLGENGREAEICQGSLEIDASDKVDATERAKRKFCETQALRHWSLTPTESRSPRPIFRLKVFMRAHPHSGASVAHLSSQAQHCDQQTKAPRQTAMRVPAKAATDRSADTAAARCRAIGGALAQAIFQRPGKLACVLETLFRDSSPSRRSGTGRARPAGRDVTFAADGFALAERKRRRRTGDRPSLPAKIPRNVDPPAVFRNSSGAMWRVVPPKRSSSGSSTPGR